MKDDGACKECSLAYYVDAFSDPVHRCLSEVLGRKVAHTKAADEGEHVECDKTGLAKLLCKNAESRIKETEPRYHKTYEYEGTCEYCGSGRCKLLGLAFLSEHEKDAETCKKEADGLHGEEHSVKLYKIAYAKSVKKLVCSLERARHSYVDNTGITLPKTITIINDWAFYYCKSLQNVIIGDSVTTIGYCAFYNCTSLEKVTIGKSVTEIGTDAFSYCTGLTEIYFNAAKAKMQSSSSGTFDDLGKNTSGTKLIIGKGVTEIPDGLFDIKQSDVINNITSVEFEDGSACASVGKYAFTDCANISSVSVPSLEFWFGLSYTFASDIPTYHGADLYIDGALVEDLVIPKEITSIPYSAFINCTSIRSLSFEEGSKIESIQNDAFNGCINLESISLPEGITYVGERAFAKCTSLKNVSIPGTVPSIKAATYYGCTSLEEVVIPDTVAAIGDGAFSGCSSLKNVTIGKGVTSIEESAFRDCGKLTKINFNASRVNDFEEENYVFSGAGVNGSGITVIFGKNVTKVPDHLFYTENSPKVTKVEFEEESVCKSIGNYAFYGCATLSDIVIPDSVTDIGEYAFYGCSALSNVVIPDSVTDIGEYAFYGCSGLDSITMGAGVTTIGDRAFAGCVKVTKFNFNAVELSDFADRHNVFSNMGKSGEGFTLAVGKNVKKIPANMFYNLYNGDEGLDSPKIAVVEFEEGSVCTSIGASAFRNGHSLTALTIPESVTTIGEYAFYYCDGLTSLSLGVGVTAIGYRAFESCTSLKELIIPDQVITIDSSAFSNCQGLIKLSIGKGVTTIKSGAFSRCFNLSEIYFNAVNMNNLSYSDEIFYSAGTKGKGIKFIVGKDATRIPNCLFSPDINSNNRATANIVTVEFEKGSVCDEIGFSAFYMCNTLTNVYIYDISAWCNIKFVDTGSNPMLYADNLHLNGELVDEVVIPDGITKISEYAFEGSSIRSVSIPSSVTQIGAYAFANCPYLANVTIPNSVTVINYGAFANCTNLMTVTLPSGLDSFESGIFSGCVKLVEICNLSDIDLSEYSNITKYALNIYSDTEGEKRTSVTEDGFVFYEDGYVCYLIGYIGKETNITIPYHCYETEIYQYAFCGNSYLESINFSSAVTAIQSHAFYGCDSLTSIVIGSRFTYTDSNIIESDRSTVNVYYLGTYEAWKNVTNGMDYFLNNSIKLHFYTETELPKNEYYGYWYYDWAGNIVVW